jgi:hypothetical protein
MIAHGSKDEELLQVKDKDFSHLNKLTFLIHIKIYSSLAASSFAS